MPPISIVSSTTSNFAFAGGEFVPENLKFPANTLIPYYGNDPGLSGWTRYSQADNNYLLGQTNATPYVGLGTTLVAVSPSITIGGSTGSAGSHSGTSVTQNIYSTGSIYACNVSDGSHSHSASGFGSMSVTGMLNTQNITFLRATTSKATLPTNALLIKQTAPVNSIAFSRTGSNFLRGANNVQTFAAGTNSTTFQISGSLSSSGAHTHSGTARGTQIPAGQRFYAYYLGYSGGSHTHTIGTSTFTQTQIAHKLMNLWQLTAESRTSTDVIVMYVGTTAPPAPWALCNGLNGTPDLGSYIIGFSDNQWNIVKASNASASGISTVSSAYTPHAHNSGGYSPANLAQSSYPGVVTGGQHSNYGWSHSHTSNIYASANGYVPPRIRVAFIQFKG